MQKKNKKQTLPYLVITIMKKFYEYMTTLFAVIGMLLIIASVGFIETDQWIAGISLALSGVSSMILTLVFQEWSKSNEKF